MLRILGLIEMKILLKNNSQLKSMRVRRILKRTRWGRMKRHLIIVVNYLILNKTVKVTQLKFDISIPDVIELEISEDIDDVEQTRLGEEEKVELDMRELEREEEEYIEEEMAEDK